ncbi:MAG: hypothetical protein H6622_08880 [Halobacteriovoraceae bacterium]|nr:hypothetical protein [Halobacteriovoraceae bacterium]
MNKIQKHLFLKLMILILNLDFAFADSKSINKLVDLKNEIYQSISDVSQPYDMNKILREKISPVISSLKNIKIGRSERRILFEIQYAALNKFRSLDIKLAVTREFLELYYYFPEYSGLAIFTLDYHLKNIIPFEHFYQLDPLDPIHSLLFLKTTKKEELKKIFTFLNDNFQIGPEIKLQYIYRLNYLSRKPIFEDIFLIIHDVSDSTFEELFVENIGRIDSIKHYSEVFALIRNTFEENRVKVIKYTGFVGKYSHYLFVHEDLIEEYFSMAQDENELRYLLKGILKNVHNYITLIELQKFVEAYFLLHPENLIKKEFGFNHLFRDGELSPKIELLLKKEINNKRRIFLQNKKICEKYFFYSKE